MPGGGLAHRLARLPVATVLDREVRVASGAPARLLGLARLDREEAGPGLLIRRCRSVHTFGMRFALDLVFLDGDGRALSVRRAVPPRRFAADRRATAVLELPACVADPRTSLAATRSSRQGGEFSRPGT